MIRLVVWCAVALGASGCDPSVTIEGTITIDPAFTPPADARVLVIIAGFDRVMAFTPIGLRGDDDIRDFVPSQLQYRFDASKIAGWGHAVYVAAFVDLDHDSTLRSGEPYGVSGANPLIDPPDETPGIIADVAITALAP